MGRLAEFFLYAAIALGLAVASLCGLIAFNHARDAGWCLLDSAFIAIVAVIGALLCLGMLSKVGEDM